MLVVDPVEAWASMRWNIHGQGICLECRDALPDRVSIEIESISTGCDHIPQIPR